MINEDRHDHEIKRLQGTGKAALALYDGLVWNATVSYQNEQFLWSDYNSSKSQIVKKNGKAHRHTTADRKKYLRPTSITTKPLTKCTNWV